MSLDVTLRHRDVHWRPRAHEALQRGVAAIESELGGAGIDPARLTVQVRNADEGAADVHAELHTPGGKLVEDAIDPDLAEALRGVLRALARAVDRGEAAPDDPTPPTEQPAPSPSPGMRTPWRMLVDHAHRYAHHEVLVRQRRGELVAGRTDARDLAEAALADEVERGPVLDLAAALDRVRSAVDAEVRRAVESASTDDDTLHLEAPQPPAEVTPNDLGDTLYDWNVIDASTDTARDRIGEAGDAAADLDTRRRRARLTGALFQLSDDDRQLFAEAVIDDLPVAHLAAARQLDEDTLQGRLGTILTQLADRLDLDRRELVTAYVDLGEQLRAERIDPKMPVGPKAPIESM